MPYWWVTHTCVTFVSDTIRFSRHAVDALLLKKKEKEASRKLKTRKSRPDFPYEMKKNERLGAGAWPPQRIMHIYSCNAFSIVCYFIRRNILFQSFTKCWVNLRQGRISMHHF
jgi:hypothetical protein